MNMFKERLKEIFGHEDFREAQLPIIQSILAHKNTVAILPTGAGKSLCYQFPAVTQPGMAVVISPLIALMKNQVDALKARNIHAAFLTSVLSRKSLSTIKNDALDGTLKLLYMSPETLNKEESIQFLQQVQLSFIVIDEVHCISEWGHDFRPEYRKLKNTIAALGHLPVMALTATATPKVEKDIINILGIHDAALFKSSFARDNLYYEVRPKQNVNQQLIQFIKRTPGQIGIIYCQSRKKVEEINSLLQLNKIRSASYHAGLDTKERIKNQEDFLNNNIDVIVATIAFGMGIDKPDISFVIHYETPKSIEGYYQETGRAGRDGKEANCILFYDPQDLLRLKKLSSTKAVSEREIISSLLDEVAAYAASPLCRRKQILYYFGETYQARCQKCDNCQNPPESYPGEVLLGKLLQATLQTKGMLKEEQLTKLLCGVQDDYLMSNDHHLLPAFGSGKEETPRKWKSIIRQALLLGYIQKDLYYTSLISITAQGEEFLNHPTPLLLYKDHVYLQENLASEPPKQEGVDAELLEKLKELRENEAKKRGIKPYLIFQEDMLEAMAANYPSTTEQLTHLPGISLSKAEKFGPPFLSLIREYMEEHDIQPPTTVVIEQNPAKFSRKIQFIKQIDKKTDLEKLAEMYKMTYIELIKELEKICYTGVHLHLDYYIDELLDDDQQASLFDYFYQQDSDNIERACKELEGEFQEDEIRLMHIKFLSEVAN